MAITKVTSGLISADASSIDLNIDAGTLYLDVSENRVGIGTTSPTRKLSILGTGSEYINIVGGTTSGVGLLLGDSNAEINAAIICDNSTDSLSFRTGGNNTRMTIDSSGNVGIGATPPSGVRTKIKGLAEATNLATSATSAALFIEPYSGSSWGLGIGSISGQKQYIQGVAAAGDSARELSLQPFGGNCGIGTSSPSKKLHVYNTASADVALLESTQVFSTLAFKSSTNASTVTIGIDGAGNASFENKLSSGNMTFVTNGSERMRINSSGNVGIGTSSPDALLDIQSDSNPTIRLTDNKVWNSSDSGVHGTLEWFTTDASTNAARVISYIKSGNDAGSAIPNGYLTFATARGGGNAEVAQERMRIDSSGNLFVGTTDAIGPGIIAVKSTATTTGCLGLHNTNNGGSFIRFSNAANNAVIGVIQNNNDNSTSYITTSDYRLKENVNYDFNALDRISQLKPARFNFINDVDTTVDGFLAHEVQSIVPEAITGEKDAVDDEGNPDYQGIDQSKLVPLLTKAIQELSDKVDNQQTIIDDLKTRIETLENA